MTEQKSKFNFFTFYERYGLFIILAVMLFCFGIINPNFLSKNNLLNILRQISIYGIMASGMTVVLLCGEIDLTPGALVAFSGVIMAMCVSNGMNMFLAAVIGVLVAGAVGALNGFFTMQFKLPSMLVTLGFQFMIRGIGYVITDGKPVYGLPKSFETLGGGYIVGIPIPIICLVIVAVVFIIFLKYTKFGRYYYAVGGNKEAANLCGISPKTVVISAMIISAMCSGFSGVIWASRLASGQPTVGLTYEMQVIAAVVIGGTSLTGGEGNVARSYIGAIILGVLYNGLNLIGVNPYWQQVATGGIIIAAITLDSLNRINRK